MICSSDSGHHDFNIETLKMTQVSPIAIVKNGLKGQQNGGGVIIKNNQDNGNDGELLLTMGEGVI
jgi:hypothetical protein